jgi:hypothetical protein
MGHVRNRPDDISSSLISDTSIPLITDVNALLECPDLAIYPGLDPSFQGHSGFLNEQAKYVLSPFASIVT